MVDALAELMATDFRALPRFRIKPMAMTGHIRFTAIDDQAATSRPVIDLIRRDLGFDGLLMSDDIGMQALSGSMAERAAAIIGAGCDLVLSCNEISPDGDDRRRQRRHVRPFQRGTRRRWRCPPAGNWPDAGELRAELAALAELAA